MMGMLSAGNPVRYQGNDRALVEELEGKVGIVLLPDGCGQAVVVGFMGERKERAFRDVTDLKLLSAGDAEEFLICGDCKERGIFTAEFAGICTTCGREFVGGLPRRLRCEECARVEARCRICEGGLED